MRYLIVLEQTEAGFAVQAPDLAIATFGKDVEEAKRAAVSAIKANLESYSEIGMEVPARKSVNDHLKIRIFPICSLHLLTWLLQRTCRSISR